MAFGGLRIVIGGPGRPKRTDPDRRNRRAALRTDRRQPMSTDPSPDPAASSSASPPKLPPGDRPWVAMTTLPSEKSAQDLARELVTAGLAGCAQVVPGLTSHYRYEGRLHADMEWLLLIKTTAAGWARLAPELEARHPYEVPELLAWPAQGWSGPYAAWLAQMVSPEGGAREA